MTKDDDSGHRKSRKRSSEKRKKSSGKSRRREDDDDSISSNSSSNSRHHKKRSSSKKKKSKKEHKKDHHHHQKRHKKEDRREHNNERKYLYDLGAVYGRSPSKHLTSSDYFDFHKHLWLYLYRTKNLIFDELSSKETRRYFDEFCHEYNRGNLPMAYYETNLPRPALDECQTTRHKWGFSVSKELEFLQQNVYQQTEQKGQQQLPAMVSAATICQEVPTTQHGDTKLEASTKRPTMVGPSRPPADNPMDKNDLPSRKRSRFDRAGDKEEKPDFSDRRLLEKKQIGERTHGAHRDRDAVELTDDAVYGGGDTEFQRALEQQKRRNASRHDRQAARLTELQEKEAQKQKEMLERLGLAKR